jgi:hypothetical protein
MGLANVELPIPEMIAMRSLTPKIALESLDLTSHALAE